MAQKEDKAKRILDKVAKKYKKYKTFKFSFNQRMVNEVENIDESFSGKITVMGDKFRLVVGEQEVYNGGDAVWTYLKDANEVHIEEIDDDEEINPGKIFELYKKNYNYTISGTKIINGKQHIVVDLGPEEKDDVSFYKIRMTIEEKTSALKKFIVFDNNGNKYVYTISNFESNMPINDDFFVFNVAEHKGVEVIDLR